MNSIIITEIVFFKGLKGIKIDTAYNLWSGIYEAYSTSENLA